MNYHKVNSPLREVNRKNLKKPCQMCKETFDDSAMWKSEVYYNITKEAEELRAKGTRPWEWTPGIVNIIDGLDCSEEKKQAMKDDLKYNYELRTHSYCQKCVGLANFMLFGPRCWIEPKVKVKAKPKVKN